MMPDEIERLIYQDLEDYNAVTIKELQFEYLIQTLKSEWEERKKAIIELWDKIKEAYQPVQPIVTKANWQHAWRGNFNNYRKLHALPMMRRSRCRWRPRESRRSLDGLSPGIVIIDEYAFADEQPRGSEAS